MILNIAFGGFIVLYYMLRAHLRAAVADFRNSYPGLSTRETVITLCTWW